MSRHIIGATEETTTGVRRLRALQKEGGLRYPVIAVNDAGSKNLFDNRYGTGQSVMTAIMTASNRAIGGSTVVVAGYGMCGKGVALRARGLGAHVVVCEVDPVKAAEAMMDGYRVMPMDDAAEIGDLFITVTGCRDVIRRRHFARMKDNAMLANAGHFDVEINIGELSELSYGHRQMRPDICGFKMPDGRILCLLAEGRLVNLAAGDGHPIEIMDMSFSLQAECMRYIAASGGRLPVEVLPVPEAIDRSVSAQLLGARGVAIDRLTQEQSRYLGSFQHGE
ncbi:MAG: Adenosylhomocysteinase [Chloroflexi bacterium ADurb.Bin360]|nr:MAG: Adenosylhomocysteinase [Chloroflexi bacterium ADurb.Bin360]